MLEDEWLPTTIRPAPDPVIRVLTSATRRDIRAAPDRLAGALADPRNHLMWWPHLALVLDRDRGTEGRRWVVTGAGS